MRAPNSAESLLVGNITSEDNEELLSRGEITRYYKNALISCLSIAEKERKREKEGESVYRVE